MKTIMTRAYVNLCDNKDDRWKMIVDGKPFAQVRQNLKPDYVYDKPNDPVTWRYIIETGRDEDVMYDMHVSHANILSVTFECNNKLLYSAYDLHTDSHMLPLCIAPIRLGMSYATLKVRADSEPTVTAMCVAYGDHKLRRLECRPVLQGYPVYAEFFDATQQNIIVPQAAMSE
jgi:hypothetical protein